MKKLLLLFTLLLLIQLPSQAQLLWEISGNGLKRPSYLYGTMHIGDDRVYDFNDSLLTVFYKCDIVAGELVIKQDLFTGLNMLLGMRMKGDTTLSDLLPREKYALVKRKLDKRLDEMGILYMANYIEQIKPFFISVLLSDLGKVSASSRPAIDLYFQNIAREKNIEVVGLETVEEQMSVFDRISLKKQAEMLYEELNKSEEDAEQAKEEMDKLIDIYASENLDSLYQLTLGEFDTQMNAELLDKRNINMADRMVPYMKRKKKTQIFVAVGAAHLPGEGGVINLLRKKGYTLRAVNFPAKKE